MRPSGGDVWFSIHNMVLTIAQAACVVLPAAGLPLWANRFRTGAWALVMPLSIAIVVGAIAVLPWTADALTWIALILVPIGCALALGWAMHGARWWMAIVAVPLLAVTWAYPDSPGGQLCAVVLIAGSAVSLGRLLAGAAPLSLLKIAVIAMAVIDAILVFSNNLQPSNAVLVAAIPAPGLPRLQSSEFMGSGLGYGDYFAAAVVGGILAVERGPQVAAFAAMLVVSIAWKQLFLIYDVLPATIPPAIVLIGYEVWRHRHRRRASDARAEPAVPPEQQQLLA
jgi:hypothetical protein